MSSREPTTPDRVTIVPVPEPMTTVGGIMQDVTAALARPAPIPRPMPGPITAQELRRHRPGYRSHYRIKPPRRALPRK